MHQFIARIFRSDKPQPEPPIEDAIDLPAAMLQRIHEQGLLLAYASETGFIDEVADMTQHDLESLGIVVRPVELDEVDSELLQRETPVLFMTSTTGSGDAPFAADRFWTEVMAEPADLAHLHFGLLCAGDTDYDNFCGFGRELRDWLLASGAEPLFAPIEVDCEEEETIERWRRQVKQLFATVTA